MLLLQLRHAVGQPGAQDAQHHGAMPPRDGVGELHDKGTMGKATANRKTEKENGPTCMRWFIFLRVAPQETGKEEGAGRLSIGARSFPSP